MRCALAPYWIPLGATNTTNTNTTSTNTNPNITYCFLCGIVVVLIFLCSKYLHQQQVVQHTTKTMPDRLLLGFNNFQSLVGNCFQLVGNKLN